MFNHSALRALSLLVALLYAGKTGAQGITFTLPSDPVPVNVVAAEYYFDTDPGLGNATGLPLVPGVDVQISNEPVSIAGLQPGVHRIVTRVKDQRGNWSQSSASFLYILNAGLSLAANNAPIPITKAEYFFDTDPGYGNGINIPLSSDTVVNLSSVAVSIGSLVSGVHRFFVRTRDQQGRWSHAPASMLYIVNNTLDLPATTAPASITRAEYFFDTDPGFGNATDIPLTTGMLVDLNNVPVSISSLANGAHRYYIRTRNQQGNWSHSNSSIFSILTTTISFPANTGPDSIRALEYFVDTDPGFGNGTLVPVAATTDLTNYSLSANISGLPDGLHTLYVRTLRPSALTTARTFYVGIPLPLDFLNFAVSKEERDARISWETAAAFSADYFQVERSQDGKDFASLAVVPPNEKHVYRVTDKELTALKVPVVYYRIKAVDQSGKQVYTKTLSLRLTGETGDAYAYIYPNPVQDKLHLQYHLQDGTATGRIMIRDNAGKLLQEKEMMLPGGNREAVFDLSQYAAGIYYIELVSGSWSKNMKLLKQ